MCFVFILTENKWYIFLKKEIKRHTEKVCGTVKGAKVQTKTLKWTDSFKKIKLAMRALIYTFP